MTGSPDVRGAAGVKVPWLELLLVFLVLFVPLQVLMDAAEMAIFTTRDLDRAQLLANGRLILFGPEASAGGQLPGPFYYFLLAVPLKLGFGWKAAWQLQFGMMAAAFSLLWLFARVRFGVYPAYFMLFCAAFFNYMTLVVSNNASFMPLFAAVSLTALCVAFDGESRRRGAAWAAFCLACGLGLQLHMSFILLLLAGPVVQLLAGKLGLKPLPWKTFAAGLAAFLATLLPYGLWLLSVHFGHPIGQPALSFTGGAEADLAGIMKHGAEARAGKNTLLARYITLLPFAALAPLAALFFSGGAAKGAARPPEGNGRSSAAGCLKVLSVAAALTLALYAMTFALSPSRYAVVPRMCLAFLACAFLACRHDRLRPRVFYPLLMLGVSAFFLPLRVLPRLTAEFTQSLPYFWFPAAAGAALALALYRRERSGALFSLAPVLPLLLSASISSNLPRHLDHAMPGTEDFTLMSRAMVARTGWSYEEARLRIYYVNVRDKATPSWIYRAAAAREAPRGVVNTGPDRVDGYFAALFWERIPDPGNIAMVRRWLLDQDIPGMLKQGVRSGGIALGEPSPRGRLLLVPYTVGDTERFPPYFHNSSEGYSLTAPLPAPVPGAGEKAFRLTFNDCPGGQAFCDIHADVLLRREKAGRWRAGVALSGEPLSQVCYGVNLQWNQRLVRSYFYAVCGGSGLRVPLADTLGMHRDRCRSMNRSILGPYRRDFQFSCPGRLERVGVGYGSASAYYLDKVLDLPGRELSAEVADDAREKR